jgi:hypothetical protein
LRALGTTCRETIADEDVQTFVEIYGQAMKRLGAPMTYIFPNAWFEGFLRSTEATTRLFICELNGIPIGGGLVTMCKGLVQMHLAAVANDYVSLSPLKLLFDYVRIWAVQHNASIFHLGGGVGAKDDSLYAFKSGFSRTRHLFYSWRWVVNHIVHDRLVETKDQFNKKNGVVTLEGFFPSYRAPVIRQKTLAHNCV